MPPSCVTLSPSVPPNFGTLATSRMESTSKSEVPSTPSAKAAKIKPAKLNSYPFYSPRFWHGMRPAAWWRLLRSGSFEISPSRIPMVISVSLTTFVNTLLTWLQNVLFARRLREAELHGPPVFIVGHWRSGTTLLHELMVRDERFSSPSTFQCFAPSHFLVTQWFFRKFASWLLPGKRPMDNMDAGWERPQEDEFALMNLGLPSPYRRIAFPRRNQVDMEYLDLIDVSNEDRETWLSTLRSFLLRVSVSTNRPLVIKSPTHTGRIGHLARAFPQAKFVHITRDPRSLFPSTCRLWRSLDEVQSLQTSDEEGLDEYVLTCLSKMYDSFHADRQEIDEHHIIDIRYEDLITDPVGTLRTIYESLRLSDFDTVSEDIQDWADNEHRQYKTNKHQLDPDQEKLLLDRWSDYFDRYGYR